MDEDQNQGVQNVDETTTSVSPDTQQTTDTSANVDASTTDTAAAQSDPQQTVPYDRFSEVNEKYRQTEDTVRQLQQEIAAMKQSKPSAPVDPEKQAQLEQAKTVFKQLADELGYVSQDDIRRQKQDEALESDLKALEKEFDGKKNPDLKFNRKEVIDYAIKEGFANPRVAFEYMKRDVIMNQKIQDAIAKSKGIQTEGSNGSGSQNVGVSNEELKQAMAKGDKQAQKLYLKRVAKSVFSRGE